nr:MAG TPA: hypothetical protein [Caudoviricetes sp.]
MAGGVHGHLVQTAGLSGIAGVDIVVCALGNACQLILFGIGVIVGGKTLACHIIHLAGQVHGGVIQQLHGVAAVVALDLGVDIVVLGGSVHHQIQHVLLGSIRSGHVGSLFKAGVAGLGNGGVDGRHYLFTGLVSAVVGQLAGLGGHGDIHALIRCNGLRGAVHLDALDLVGLCAGLFQHTDAGGKGIGLALLALGQVLQMLQGGDVVRFVVRHSLVLSCLCFVKNFIQHGIDFSIGGQMIGLPDELIPCGRTGFGRDTVCGAAVCAHKVGHICADHGDAVAVGALKGGNAPPCGGGHLGGHGALCAAEQGGGCGNAAGDVPHHPHGKPLPRALQGGLDGVQPAVACIAQLQRRSVAGQHRGAVLSQGKHFDDHWSGLLLWTEQGDLYGQGGIRLCLGIKAHIAVQRLAQRRHPGTDRTRQAVRRKDRQRNVLCGAQSQRRGALIGIAARAFGPVRRGKGERIGAQIAAGVAAQQRIRLLLCGSEQCIRLLLCGFEQGVSGGVQGVFLRSLRGPPLLRQLLGGDAGHTVPHQAADGFVRPRVGDVGGGDGGAGGWAADVGQTQVIHQRGAGDLRCRGAGTVRSAVQHGQAGLFGSGVVPQHQPVDAAAHSVGGGQGDRLRLLQDDAATPEAGWTHPCLPGADGHGQVAVCSHGKVLVCAVYAAQAGAEVPGSVVGVVGDAVFRVGDDIGHKPSFTSCASWACPAGWSGWCRWTGSR